MKRVMAMGLLSLTLGACANAVESGPSFLGLASAFADDSDTVGDAGRDTGPSPAIGKVKSNKVLGAMAFQRVTGRPVDPSRLTGE